MYEHYFIYAHKIGNKTMSMSPIHRVVSKDGKVILSKSHNGEDVTMCVMLLIRDMQESGRYQKVILKKCEDDGCDKGEKMYEWAMETEAANVRRMTYDEYSKKRKELKAKIAELEAELEKLDKEW